MCIRDRQLHSQHEDSPDRMARLRAAVASVMCWPLQAAQAVAGAGPAFSTRLPGCWAWASHGAVALSSRAACWVWP
eukprot:1849060-Alexandrium_andersonii.AAC.1